MTRRENKSINGSNKSQKSTRGGKKQNGCGNAWKQSIKN
jgi:hypothetical protein